MRKLLIMLMILITGAIAQELNILYKISNQDRKYVNYIGDAQSIPNSFAVDSSFIYINNPTTIFQDEIYVLNYKKPLSLLNPTKIVNFSGLGLNKSGDLLVNVGLQAYSIQKNKIWNILNNAPIVLAQNKVEIRFSLYKSHLCYFKRSGNSYRNITGYMFDINKNKYINFALKNFMKYEKEKYGELTDILLNGNYLYSIVDGYYNNGALSQSKIIAWDIKADTMLYSYLVDTSLYIDHIIGMDKWNNLYAYGGVSSSEYILLILSPNGQLIKIKEISSLIKNMKFMKKNYLLDSDYSDDPLIVPAFSDDKQLFLMVKTKKGLFFLSYNYLSLLRKLPG